MGPASHRKRPRAARRQAGSPEKPAETRPDQKRPAASAAGSPSWSHKPCPWSNRPTSDDRPAACRRPRAPVRRGQPRVHAHQPARRPPPG
eukprot:950871-Pyramimonas_sp.AAC.1